MRHAFVIPTLTKSNFGKNQSYKVLSPYGQYGVSTKTSCGVSGLKREMLERYAEDFRKEIAVMEQLQHTNIVKFYGVCKGGMICLFDLILYVPSIIFQL